MRKSILVLLLCIFVSGIIFSQVAKPDPTKQKSSIEVTYPNAGLTLNASTVCLIRWDRQGIQNIKAKITLLKSTGEEVKVISYSTSNTGNHLWVIPYNLKEGSYKIQVKAGSITDISGIFTIKKPNFSLYEPSAGEVLTIGEQKTIRWNASNAEGVRVEIRIYKEEKFPRMGDTWLILASNIKADEGEYTWTVGKSVNGTHDLWTPANLPEDPVKCQIGIFLQIAPIKIKPISVTKYFYVKK